MNIIVVGIIGALLFFGVQLALCYKAKKTAVKLIPLYAIIPFIIIMVLDFAGLLEYNSVISTQGILGMILAIITGAALIGVALAWLVYKTKKRKS